MWLNFKEMSFGTKLRTILAIVTSLNTALMATDLTGFENPTVDLWYKILSIIFNFIIVAITTYFNNDYSKGAAIGTAAGRIYNADPTTVIDVHDADEDDDEDDDDEDGDVEIKEGDDNELE